MKEEYKKKLNENEQKEIAEYILSNFTFNDELSYLNFCKIIYEYVKNVRRDVNSLKKNIDEIIELFFISGYTNDQVINIISKEPSLLHEDKNKTFWKLLLLGKVYNTKSLLSVRDSDFISNPRMFRTSNAVIYARIKYLESEEGKEYLRNKDFLTKRQIIKCTNEEFENSYKKSKEELLKLFPFDNKAELEIVSWDENKEFLDNIFGKRI